ncbi:MAG TPA: hypothetical protein VMH05_11610 [Bryobacteraceae bacterium]|nr:hypothetical protein [Bryobacteraceae bacterium]
MFGPRSVILIALASAGAFAQPGHRGMAPPPGGPGDFAFVRGEFGFSRKVVTGAPYSAQASTQFTQTLADGTHIQRSSTASMARDSQGRTRTEQTMSSIGPLSASGATPRTTVFIHDPVASMSYVLDPSAHTVRQMQISQRGPQSQNGTASSRARPMAHARHGANATTEDLGTQVIQGLNATGTRVTRTIAAGSAGNDRAIQVVTETWYSPDLQMVVMSKSSDPRFGESVYQLTNITRAEPDPTLFTVPSGYTVMQGGPGRGRPAPQQ